MPGSGPKRPASPPAVDTQLLVDPIGFLQIELYRQRVACNTLEALADATSNGDLRSDASRVLRYIVEDLPIHIADLEECLYPLLRQRSRPEDQLERLRRRYSGLRTHRGEPVAELLPILEDVSQGNQPPPNLADLARVVVESWRSELEMEIDDILPLAEKRMTDADLMALGQAMALRHGISNAM